MPNRYNLTTPEGREALRRLRDERLAAEFESATAYRRARDRVRQMVRDGIPHETPEWLVSLRKKMWRSGEPETVTVRGRELLPVDRMAARGTGKP